MLTRIRTDLLDIALQEGGNPQGWPVVLLHGFPYDIHAYAEVAALLGAQGAPLAGALSARASARLSDKYPQSSTIALFPWITSDA